MAERRSPEDQNVETSSIAPELQSFIRECEVTGRRTIFSRQDSPVAILVSYDEYLALRETIDIASHPEILRDIHQGEAEASRGALLLPEDLIVE